MMEIWKDILGFEGRYAVSDLGNFKSLEKKENSTCRYSIRKERVLKPSADSSGYLQIGLMEGKRQRRHLCHRLVAFAFIEKIEGRDFINHKNGIKTDNRVENLEWCTKSENCIHSFEIGLQCNKGINHPAHILTEKQVLEIRKKYVPRSYSSYKLAKEYSVNRVTINDIINRKTWSHI